MRKTTGFLTNDTDNVSINRPLLVEPIQQPHNHRCLIGGIIILTHTLTFLLGCYVNDMWIKDNCSMEGSQ